ncbi:MAG TPA: tetratricopeptide repeat protein [Candidatus Sulfotelmatobacter sp.]|nr:tetratricopeptide repeat protein [Candidatus Sulfotelmatobacter sp.]
MRTPARLMGAALLAVLLAGCGHQLLWERWQAERAFWQADREVARIFVNPRVARPEDYRRAESAFARIARIFPAEAWVARREPMAREIAEISGRATLALARLAELQGRSAEALSGYRRVIEEWPDYDRLRLDALEHLGDALESNGDGEGAMRAWERMAREFAPLDSARDEVRPAVLEAPLALAVIWEQRGDRARRDSTLVAAELRLESSMRRVSGSSASVALLDAIARGRELRGDVGGALDAWRETLSAGGADTARASRIIQLGERELEAGRADSARVYARWGAEFDGPPRLRALELLARSFERGGEPDSALDVYAGIVSEFPHNDEATAGARYQRALILERLDRWAQARSEFGALCAAQPTHPLALEAWTRVVEHYRKLGESELARIEADHGLAALDLLISTQHDDAVRLRCFEARASVQLADDRVRDAAETLRGLWAAAPVTVAGARLGAEAARRAGADLHDAALAGGLWQILAERSPDPDIRREAGRALGRPVS